MSEVIILCPQCGKTASKATGAVNRSRKIGAPIYCSRVCSSLASRSGKSIAQKKEEKRLYDIQYRLDNAETLRAQKAAYFQRTYDPEAARIDRKAKMPRHLEYCRQPKYKKYKQQYDRQYRAREFGAFADVFLLLQDLVREINQRSSDYERRIENQTYGKSQRRRRDYTRAIGRESQTGPLGDTTRG